MADIVTLSQLTAIMPHGAAAGRLVGRVSALNEWLPKFEITTPARLAMYFAQVAHETGEYRYVREIADGSAYEWRADLGNRFRGDGVRFAGRGDLQATGREMYEILSAHFGVDFVAQPQRLEEPVFAVASGCYIWTVVKRCNPLADAGAFDRTTQRINGGQNGAADRRHYWAVCKRVFGELAPEIAALRRGHNGEPVRALQRALIAAGYDCGAAGVDGDYGPATERAVRAFDAANDLEADGAADALTQKKLGLVA